MSSISLSEKGRIRDQSQSLRAHGAMIMSFLRRNGLARRFDVIMTLVLRRVSVGSTALAREKTDQPMTK